MTVGYRKSEYSQQIDVTYRIETDSAEISSLVSDLEAAQKFREETIKYIQKCLTSNEAELDVEPPSSAIIKFFQRFGPAIAKSITTGQ